MFFGSFAAGEKQSARTHEMDQERKAARHTARDRIYWPKAAVREFLAERWEQWELDPPDWFADWRWKAALPAECWPTEALYHEFVEEFNARELAYVDAGN